MAYWRDVYKLLFTVNDPRPIMAVIKNGTHGGEAKYYMDLFDDLSKDKDVDYIYSLETGEILYDSGEKENGSVVEKLNKEQARSEANPAVGRNEKQGDLDL